MVTALNYEYVRNLILSLSAYEQAKIKAELDGQLNFSFEDLISFKANTASSVLTVVVLASSKIVRKMACSGTDIAPEKII